MNRSEQQAFISVVDEVRELFHRLATAADRLHEAAGIPESQRAVLECVQREGSITVPRIAEMKSVSRQHIQTIVNQLQHRGLVELAANPAHKRSSVVQLTRLGAETFAGIRRREAALLAAMQPPVNGDALQVTAESLRALNRFFESGAWLGNTSQET